MTTNNVLSVGCRFTGRKVAIRAAFKKGDEEFILDASPWQTFIEPALEHYPLFNWMAYTVHVGLRINIDFKIASGLGSKIPFKLEEYFLRRTIPCGVLRVMHKKRITDPTLPAAMIENVREGFIYDPDGNGRPLGRWSERFWHFLESTQKEYPITMGYEGGIFGVEGGYDHELLPPFAQEIVDRYR